MWGCYCIFKENKTKVFVPRSDATEAELNYNEVKEGFKNVFNEDVSFDLNNLMDMEINHLRLFELGIITTILNNIHNIVGNVYFKHFIFICILSDFLNEDPCFISEEEGNSDTYKGFINYD